MKRLIYVVVASSCVLFFSGCGDRTMPVQPTAPSAPAPPAVVTPRSINVTCQATILSTPGEQTRCTALVTYSDGSIRDETTTVRWSAVPSTVATVTAGGLVAPVQAGVVSVGASLGNLIGSAFTIEVALPPVARIRGGLPLWMQDLDRVSYNVSESSDGKDQAYLFDFGDGVIKTEPLTGTATRLFEHIYRERGTFLVRLTLIDRQGRQATASTAIRIVSLTGTWTNSQFNPATGRNETRSLILVQRPGGGLTGSYVHPEGNREPLTGTMEEYGRIRLALTSRTISFGDSPLIKDGFTGDGDFSAFRVAVKGGSADGQTMIFKRQ